MALHSPTPEFQVAVGYWERADAPALAVHSIRFDSTLFVPAYFSSAVIACPDGIAGAVRKRQAEYFYGRLCARAALANCNAPPGPLPIGPMREPLWPPGYLGSITHSQNAAAAIALPRDGYRGVGIDIEAIATADADAQDALKAIVVSDKEFAILSAIGGTDIGLLLTAVFSAKESFFKAAFVTVQRYFGFDALELEHLDIHTRTMSFIVREALDAALPLGHRLRIIFSVLPHGDVATLYAW